MGLALNVFLSIPMGIIIYMLTEKMIISMVQDKEFNEKVQTNFVIGFVIGLAFIALAMTAFDEGGIFDNQPIQYAMYGAGVFMVLNSVFFSWAILDETTKIMILSISVIGLITYSYAQRRVKLKTKQKAANAIKTK